jgi:hypothetical protein
MSGLGRILHGLTLAFVVLAAILVEAAASASAGTLDQQQPTIGNVGYYIHSDQSLAQTFTAGIGGTLDQADLALSHQDSPDQDLIVQIRDGSASGAGDQILASTNVPPSGVTANITDPQFIAVAFNPPAPVVAGQRYAIVAYTSTVFPNSYDWSLGMGNDPYPGGAAFSQEDTPSPPQPGAWSAVTGDFGFRTYVAPSPPAPPASPTGRKHCKKRKKHKRDAVVAKKCKKHKKHKKHR